tara:strand:- start:851 stop:1465 length:615 start_codon:yes stop_codon:yes gene_type:complete
LGLREKQKKDKLLRIRSAAHDLFLERGFEGTTTRKVAEIAGVSHATVFLYAKDKRDLLFLVFNDDLDKVAKKARSAVDSSAPLVEQYMQLFRPFYTYFAKDPQIGLLGIHEYNTAVVGADSPQMERVKARAKALQDCIYQIVKSCQDGGEISADLDTELASRLIRSTYLNEIDFWLQTTQLDVEQGLSVLKDMIALIYRGLQSN